MFIPYRETTINYGQVWCRYSFGQRECRIDIDNLETADIDVVLKDLRSAVTDAYNAARNHRTESLKLTKVAFGWVEHDFDEHDESEEDT